MKKTLIKGLIVSALGVFFMPSISFASTVIQPVYSDSMNNGVFDVWVAHDYGSGFTGTFNQIITKDDNNRTTEVPLAFKVDGNFYYPATSTWSGGYRTACFSASSGRATSTSVNVTGKDVQMTGNSASYTYYHTTYGSPAYNTSEIYWALDYTSSGCFGSVIPTIDLFVPTSTSTPIQDFSKFRTYASGLATSTFYFDIVSYSQSTSTLSSLGNSTVTFTSSSSTPYSFIDVYKNPLASGTWYARAFLQDAGANNIATSSIISFVINNGYTIIGPGGSISWLSSTYASTTATTTLTQDFSGNYQGYIPHDCNWADIGCNLVNAGAFIFIPSKESIDKIGSLRYELGDRYPFNYVMPVINGLAGLATGSSTSMVSWEIKYADIAQSEGVASSSLGNMIPNVTVLSADTIQHFMPNGFLATFRGFAGFVLWLLFVQYMFFRVRDFHFST